jgi:hypothetical protein
MEASETPQITLRHAESRGVLRLVGDDSAIQDLIARDERRTGFARLALMVYAVLGRLTAREVAGRSAPRGAAGPPRS